MENCSICGSRLSDNNTTGIGFGCMKHIVVPSKIATYKKFKKLDEHIAIVKIWRNAFLNRFKDTKFRSEFRKSFFSSISESERISKKQLEIIMQWIELDDVMRYNALLKLEQTTKEDMYERFDPFLCADSEIYDFYRSMITFFSNSYLKQRVLIDQD